MTLRRLLPLLLLLPAALFAAAPLEFDGVLISDSGKIQVFLLNTSTLDVKLVPVGGKFGGYIVEACNNATGTKPEIVLVSVANRQKQTIRLKDVSVGISASAPASVGATVSSGGTLVLNNGTVTLSSGTITPSANPPPPPPKPIAPPTP